MDRRVAHGQAGAVQACAWLSPGRGSGGPGPGWELGLMSEDGIGELPRRGDCVAPLTAPRRDAARLVTAPHKRPRPRDGVSTVTPTVGPPPDHEHHPPAIAHRCPRVRHSRPPQAPRTRPAFRPTPTHEPSHQDPRQRLRARQRTGTNRPRPTVTIIDLTATAEREGLSHHRLDLRRTGDRTDPQHAERANQHPTAHPEPEDR